MTQTDPDWQISLVGQALSAFPDEVFNQWLRFRRTSTYQWYPNWKALPRAVQVITLDSCAIYGAALN